MAGTPPQADADGTVRPDVDVVTQGIRYGARSPSQVLDVYRSSAEPSGHAAPALILVHGGAWASGDKSELAAAARFLAASGFAVFNINYRSDPSGIPAYRKQVNDVRASLAWVRTHAERYGADPDRIGLLGSSAGAYLVAMVGTTEDGPRRSPVRAVVSLSGPMDIHLLVNALRSATNGHESQCLKTQCEGVETAMTALRVLLGCDAFKCSSALIDRASPINHVSRYSPPFFLVNSSDEFMPAEQAHAMASRLRSEGVLVELQVLPGDAHSIEYAGQIREPVLRFLRETLTTTAHPASNNESPARRWAANALAAVGAGVLLVTLQRAWVRGRR